MFKSYRLALMRLITILMAVIIIAFTITGNQAVADEIDENKIYQWQDEQGVLHISDSLEKVPNKYRSSVKSSRIQSPPAREQAAPERSDAANRQENESDSSPNNEELLKKAWQQRMREARDNVARLTDQLQTQVLQLQVLQNQLGSGTTYSDEKAAQVLQLEEQIKTTKNALEQSQKAVDDDIPDAARKAGIPPGWLRE